MTKHTKDGLYSLGSAVDQAEWGSFQCSLHRPSERISGALCGRERVWKREEKEQRKRKNREGKISPGEKNNK